MKAGRTGITRREMLSSLGCLALAGRFGLGVARAQEEKKKAGIALQLFTMREPAKKDLPDTLKKLADMGWKHVQWSGMPQMPAEQIREALDKAGLTCVAAHCGMEPFEKDFDAQVKFWKTVGNKDVAPGGMMKDCSKTLEDWKKGCERLDAIGAKLQAVGMRLSYHNHAGEFDKFPGDDRTKLDILMESTKPGNLCSELDIAWVHVAGVDPAAYIRKFKGRCPVVHAKDVIVEGKTRKFTPLGKGQVKWADVFAAGKEAGIEWYIYEQDSCEGSPFDCAKASFEFLSKNVL